MLMYPCTYGEFLIINIHDSPNLYALSESFSFPCSKSYRSQHAALRIEAGFGQLSTGART